MTKGGYSGTLGAQSALTLVCPGGRVVARAERGLAGQLVVGTEGTESSAGLSVAGNASACLLLRRMALSSRCSRAPKPETKGGPGDEDAFEDGLGNRNARLEEGPALHGTSGSLPGGPESGIPPS